MGIGFFLKEIQKMTITTNKKELRRRGLWESYLKMIGASNRDIVHSVIFMTENEALKLGFKTMLTEVEPNHSTGRLLKG